ncbi:ESPR-type extended signal peptide-containing protein [Acidaminococcus fermentans]|uniref:ESPR-type extended signal peptide-containing protein n=1 Tax=Acidaminococcus fermentans TaxID=905 RepID=UPI00131A521A|nr:ESPR-type extended signal peptide-containing protein [Acidaminococcus fermentans]
MNKIYKVIWNKTRGMYMVVSELAKGQSKDGRRAVGRKKVAQTAAALAVFFSVVSAGGTAWAADTTTTVTAKDGTEQIVYTQEGTNSQIKAARTYTYRKAAELDTRITNVKEYLEKQTSATYVSKADAAVQDGAIVKADKTIGENVTNLDAALAKETAARIGADAAQDKVIQAVNDNLVQSVTTINKNVADGFTALNQADAKEAAAREAKDNELNERITNEANGIHNEIKAGDEKLDTRITNVKEYLEKQTSDNYVSKADAAVQDGAIVKAANTIGENVTNLDAALAKETAARIGADKAQDAVIQQVNQNAANGIATLATAYNNEVASREAADNELNERITNEANAIHETTNKLQDDLNTETTAREAADTALDTRITNVKEYLEKQTSDHYVSKADAAVQDGAIVKAANTIGENVTNLDAALAKETAARIGADAAQDKVIEQVNQNMVDGFNTINTNMANGFAALNAADAAEKEARIGADKKLAEAVNSGLSLSEDNVLQKNTTTVADDGMVTTSKTDANAMILNKGNKNQIAMDEKGVKVGTNSSVMDADGVYTGGDTFDAAKAAMSSDGQIKGANGKFTVDASGNTSVTSLDAGTGTIQTKGDLYAKDATFSGDITAKDATLSGDLSAKDGTFSGDLSAKDGTFSGDVSAKDVTATGTLQGAEVTDGTATMQNGNLTGVKNLSAETITTSGDATIGGDLTVKGKLNVDEIDLTKSGIVGDNNVTASTKVAAGEITSYKKATSTKDGSEKESAIDYDENGTSTWAKSTDADGNWKKSTLTVEGSDVTSKVIDSEKNSNLATQTSTQSQSTLTDADKNTNTATQSAAESSSVLSDKDGNNTSSFRQRINDILQEIKSANGSTSVEQTDVNITNTAKNGTITNDAQNLVNKASDSITSQIGDGSAVKSVMDANGIANTATGGTISNSAADVINTGTNSVINQVGDNQVAVKTDSVKAAYGSDTSTTWDAKGITNTTSGDISNSAANISNTTTGNMTNTVGGNLIDTIMGTSTTTVTGKVTEDYKSDLSTKVGGDETHAVTGNQTTTVSGNRTVNVKGTETENFNALETNVKTDQKTSVGGNQTNIVGGDQQNTVSGNKLETVKGSVTEKYGSQSTTVTGDQSTHVGGNQENVVAGDQTNTISGNKTETVKGDVNESYGSLTTEVKGDSKLSADNITNTATKKLSNNAADIENSASSSILNKVGDNVSSKMEADKITTVVKDGSKSNTVTDTASTSERRLVSGNIIDILNDAENGYVNTTVSNSDGSSSTGVKQTTTDITNTAKQGSITNEAKNLVNKATEKLSNSAAEIENTATTSIKDSVGKSTVTTTDSGTTFENTDHAAAIKDGSITKTTISGNTVETGQVTTDYATVNKDLTVKGDSDLQGNATVGKNLTVNGTTTTDKLVVNSGATVTGGTTTDTLHVTSTSTFDGMATFKDAVSMDKDLTVGGNAAVAGDVTASSYKVADKTYIDQNGLNANSQKVTNVADGTIAEGSKDAVNGGQLHATNQRVSTVENRMDGVENRVDRVENRVDSLDNRIDKVGASAAAMANLHPMDFDEDSKVSVAAAVGSYRSETAGALGVFYRPTDRVMLNVSTSFGNGENMVGGGVSFKLGKSSKRLQQAEATNAALSKQVTNLQNRLDALLGVLNPNLSKAFPDVPANHWAYEAVSRLAGNDIIQGYEDGKYHGERTMSRYEMAEIIYNALSKGAKAEAKLVEEFRPELQAMAAQRKA